MDRADHGVLPGAAALTAAERAPTVSLHQAIRQADLQGIERAIKLGADVNAFDECEDFRPVSLAIAVIADGALRRLVVGLLLGAGADPKLFDDDPERIGPLFAAVLQHDAATMRMLLDAGADPNAELGTMDESLYDYAEFDYRHETGFLALHEIPSATDRASEESWLDFLDGLAIKHALPRPAHLRLLRARGARRLRERPT